MNKLKAFIPNLLTLGNLLCGCLAIIMLLMPDDLSSKLIIDHSNTSGTMQYVVEFPSAYELINFFLIAAMVLDFFDGFVARLLGVSGELGKQLDSLADNVTFGVLPSLLMFWTFWQLSLKGVESGAQTLHPLLAVFTLLIALGACYRLAVFNLQEDTSGYFKGLNTPSMTIFVLGVFDFVFRILEVQKISYGGIKNYQFFILALSVILPMLMVSNLPLFSLKFKNLTWKDNWFRYLILIISIATLVFLKVSGGFLIYFFILIIPFYIILSLIARKSFT